MSLGTIADGNAQECCGTLLNQPSPSARVTSVFSARSAGSSSSGTRSYARHQALSIFNKRYRRAGPACRSRSGPGSQAALRQDSER